MMKKFVSVIAICLIAAPVLAATPTAQSRRSMRGQMVMSAPRTVASDVADDSSSDARATASVKQINAIAAANTGVATTDKSSIRLACISNNIGVGNTFVWASRYSNTANYATMVEDTENPENNVCFVKVEVKSSDSKINVSDIPSKYFVMGNNITCGSWADEETLRQRILDAKKTARTWATVGGAVGGAGLGVGIMELFGNKLIGGAVEGQNALTGDELLLSQLRVLKKDSPSEFNDIMDALEVLDKECNNSIWDNTEKPDVCDDYNYKYLLNAKRE